MPRAVLPLFVGEDSGQVLEDIEVHFPSPAFAVEAPSKTVEVTRCHVIPGKVIVVGRVIKQIPFKTAASETVVDGRRPVRIVCGDLRHCTAIIPFRLFIPIPNAREGDHCEVLEACVMGEVDTLVRDGDNLIAAIIETIDIHVRARVTRPGVVNVSGAREPLVHHNFVPFGPVSPLSHSGLCDLHRCT